jgi:hypothetical protein
MRAQGFEFDDERDNRSVVTAEMLFDGLARFFQTPEWHPDMGALAWAKKEAWKAFGHKEGEPYLQKALDPESIQGYLQLTHSSGLPHMTNKLDAFAEDWSLAQQIKDGEAHPPPVVPFTRGGFGEDGPRIRLVWGYPQSMTIIEAEYMGPLMDYFLEDVATPMAITLTEGQLRGVVQGLENYSTRYGLDFSRFDASLHPWLLNASFDILESHFIPSDRDAFDIVRRYAICTPIVMPDGNVYVKQQGMPSGSFTTQPGDSIVTYIAIQYAAILLFGRPLPRGQLLVLGDDSVFGHERSISLAQFAKVLSELGLTLNVEKSVIGRASTPIHFLGHEWLKGFKTRPLEELAQRCVYPERSTTLERTHWRTRLIAICLTCDNGLALLLRLMGLIHPEQLFVLEVLGDRPEYGFRAGVNPGGRVIDSYITPARLYANQRF